MLIEQAFIALGVLERYERDAAPDHVERTPSVSSDAGAPATVTDIRFARAMRRLPPGAAKTS